MRNSMVFPSTVRRIGNGYFIPIPTKFVMTMEIKPDDDLDIQVSRPE